MATENETSVERSLKRMNSRIRLLQNKMDNSKKRDFYDYVQLIFSLVSGIIFAGIGLYLTLRSDKASEELEKHKLQIANAELKTTELNALSTLTPLLASDNPNVRHYANMAIQSITHDVSGSLPDKSHSPRNSLEIFLMKVKSEKAPLVERIKAARILGYKLLSSGNSPSTRYTLVKYLTDLSTDNSVPHEIKSLSAEYIDQLNKTNKQLLYNDEKYYSKILELSEFGMASSEKLFTASENLFSTRLSVCLTLNDTIRVFKKNRSDLIKLKKLVTNLALSGSVITSDTLAVKNYILKNDIELRRAELQKAILEKIK